MPQQPLPFKLSEIKYQYDLKTAKFELDAIQNELLNMYLRTDQRFRYAYNTDFTPQFLRMLQDKAKLHEPINISTMGHTRGGKSESMMTIAILHSALYGKTFTADYICGNSIDFLEKLKDFPEEMTKDSIFHIDEEKQAMYSYGSIAKKTKLVDVQNITAKYNVSTIMICPTRFSNSEADYGCRVFGRDMNQKVNRFMLFNLQEKSKGGVLPMGMVYIPIFTKVFPESYTKSLREEYIKIKDSWVKNEIMGSSDVLAEMRLKIAKKFSNDSEYLELNKQEKISYLSMKLGSEWTKSEVDDIYSLTKIIEKGIDVDK